MDYSTDRKQEGARETTDLPSAAWKGITAEIRTRIQDGSFGARYPEQCPDGTVPCGTDEDSFWGAVAGDIPELSEGHQTVRASDPPSVMATMVLIMFCWKAVGKPERFWYHKFFDHHHLRFDVDKGRQEFREVINRIFSRNEIAYTLTEQGMVEPLVSEDVSPVVHARHYTGDNDLDEMLDRSRQKFLSASDADRRESLQVLWAAWERLKTLGGKDKRSGISELLDLAAGSDKSRFRSILEDEAKKLTAIGNSFQIRHSETDQERLEFSEHIDYLARRMFSFIYLILRHRVSPENPGDHSPQANPWNCELPF